MLQFVLAQVHYQPDSWKDHAHTDYVQAEFGHMFQLKYVRVSAARTTDTSTLHAF